MDDLDRAWSRRARPTPPGLVGRPRQASAARAVARARGGDLAGADLALLHDAAWWLGLVEESIATGTDAYRALVADDDGRLAAWVAIGVAVNHLLRDEDEPGLAWLDRAGAAADRPARMPRAGLPALRDRGGSRPRRAGPGGHDHGRPRDPRDGPAARPSRPWWRAAISARAGPCSASARSPTACGCSTRRCSP